MTSPCVELATVQYLLCLLCIQCPSGAALWTPPLPPMVKHSPGGQSLGDPPPRHWVEGITRKSSFIRDGASGELHAKGQIVGDDHINLLVDVGIGQ